MSSVSRRAQELRGTVTAEEILNIMPGKLPSNRTHVCDSYLR